MSGEELDQWVEFFQEEPFGNEEKMNDLRSAKLCSMIAVSAGAEIAPAEFMVYSQIQNDDDEQVEDWESKLLRAITKM